MTDLLQQKKKKKKERAAFAVSVDSQFSCWAL